MTAAIITPQSAASIEHFSPLSHRCEPIGIISGVHFFNSSIDTTPTRTARTLSSFPYDTVLLLGGLGKGCSLFPLLSAVCARCRAVIGFGSFFVAFKVGYDAVGLVSEEQAERLEYPYTHWVMMGLKGRGGYNKADSVFTSNIDGKENKKEENIKVIKI